MTPRTKSRLADQHLTRFRELQRQLDDLYSLRLGMFRQIEGLEAGSDRRLSLEASVEQIDEQIAGLQEAADETRRTLRVIGVDVSDGRQRAGAPAYA